MNFAGLKDSNAVTIQYASARSSRADDPPVRQGEEFDAERVGYLPRPITRGMMAGNRSGLSSGREEDISDPVDARLRDDAQREDLPNFFGYQRFGLRGMVNHRVGRAVLMRDFREAARASCWASRGGARARGGRGQEACRAKDATRRLSGLFSPRQDIERKVAAYLAEKPGDYLGALQEDPDTSPGGCSSSHTSRTSST